MSGADKIASLLRVADGRAAPVDAGGKRHPCAWDKLAGAGDYPTGLNDALAQIRKQAAK